MTYAPKTTKGILLSSVSAIALMAGCTGPFDPNGTIGGSIQLGPDGKPTFSITGDFVVGNDPKEEPEVKPHVNQEKAAQEANIEDGKE